MTYTLMVIQDLFDNTHWWHMCYDREVLGCAHVVLVVVVYGR